MSLTDLSKISLKSKMIILVLVPLMALIVMTSLFLNQSIERYFSSKNLIGNIEFLEQVHYLVDNLQLERGLSNAFIAGANNQDKLISQRKKVDEYLDKVNSYKGKEFLINGAQNFFAELESLHKNRILVDGKLVSSKDNVKNYTHLIKISLDYYLVLAGESEKLSFGKNISSLRILEEAKEYEGLLRATLSAVFASNSAIGQADVSRIVTLYTGVQSNLNSPLISLSDEAEKKIVGFKDQNHWKFVSDKYELVLSKASTGDYHVDSMTFFSEISRCVSDLNEIVVDFMKVLKERADNFAQQALWQLINTILMLLVLIVFLVLMLVFFVKSINGPMLKITSSLFDSSQEVNSAAQHISDASQLLAESANAQASSIEEILPPWRN